MKLPLKFAFKYLFARKMSLVNIISMISVFGVAGMSAALIVILSIFNGFDSFIRSMINQFNPDLQVVAEKGKTMLLDSVTLAKIEQLPNVKAVSGSIEETALFQYRGHQLIAKIKGVSDNYSQIADIESNTYIGNYVLQDKSSGVPFAIVGADIAGSLGVNVDGTQPLVVYAPLRNDGVSIDPSSAFSSSKVIPMGIFHIHQDFDAKYVIVPSSFARNLMEYSDGEYSALEIAVSDYSQVGLTAQSVRAILGDGYSVKDRYQQQDMLYKIMQSEKLSIIVMLSFIIIIASFNIVGALTMLIIDKKHDIQTLSHLGASDGFIKSIFANTGRLITLTGALSGLVLGLAVCWLQIKFHFLKFPEDGSFLIDYYPVEVEILDVATTLGIVTIIGFIASVLPIRRINIKL